MAISKRDLETAALNWKVRAENAQTRVAELEHALNLLANDAVEWFSHHQMADGAHHDFGIAVAFEVPIRNPITRIVRDADVEHLPLIFWKTKWPDGNMFITVNSPQVFLAVKNALLQEAGKVQANAELAGMVERVAGEWEAAHRRYVANREQPVIH